MIEFESHDLIYEPISVAKAAELDYHSFNENGYSSFSEMRSMLDSVNFKLIKNNEVVYNSETDALALPFNLARSAYNALKNEFCMSREEIENFNKECEIFLNSEEVNQRMPYELLLAKNIFNGEMQLSLSDLETMEIKKYEKIQLALGLLRKKVSHAE
jgi:hypothetical protein